MEGCSILFVFFSFRDRTGIGEWNEIRLDLCEKVAMVRKSGNGLGESAGSEEKLEESISRLVSHSNSNWDIVFNNFQHPFVLFSLPYSRTCKKVKAI